MSVPLLPVRPAGIDKTGQESIASEIVAKSTRVVIESDSGPAVPVGEGTSPRRQRLLSEQS